MQAEGVGEDHRAKIDIHVSTTPGEPVGSASSSAKDPATRSPKSRYDWLFGLVLKLLGDCVVYFSGSRSIRVGTSRNGLSEAPKTFRGFGARV